MSQVQVDRALAGLIVRAPLPAGWRAERMSALDVAAVAAVEQAAFAFPWSRGNFEDSLKSGHLGIVLRDGGNQVAGYLILMPVVDEMHLLNVTVAPAWQRQGLGRWLLRAAQALTLAHGFASLLLEVRPSNAGAIALYRRVGFAEIGRRKRYYPAENNTREDALVMRIACEAGGVEAA
ncbi:MULTISPECIES: ribosomal protein S18-alanine N-acetyltransferase [Ralstonia solanacearum species complex]|uniref:[Ribosomal protein bS18]-alanine N-acetyltransferase n=3 Tax=Ralstonia solanacearum species complex TaxID=3116862 RepID=A0A0K1ZKS7_RALSL|nr:MULTISPECIES: ribosomal protein S18-alanine N-acetyltransferase [Ralstonia]AKZ26645.1 acyltransferase [Ralstonia solanacearum]AGH83927.1 Ribosomal-protein-S18p-alanine acetyltransferase [Ralstonia pseudosolanacearum FQY_4]ANH33283.1 acyltransferase [Ralstonia solanacearum]AOE89460.1 Ribosomal-protein-alanine N-acetyltransferase [Ralstonia solanacearum]ARU20944.1 membrane protein [Ralstonia solanacearum]